MVAYMGFIGFIGCLGFTGFMVFIVFVGGAAPYVELSKSLEAYLCCARIIQLPFLQGGLPDQTPKAA